MGMLTEFKEFAMRGNVIDLAVGVVSSGKPGGHREAKRYPAMLDAITAAFPRMAAR